VLIFVAPEADSLCACRILTNLLRSDCIAYKIKPIAGYDDLFQADKEMLQANSEIRNIIMLNCGSLVDLEEFLHLGEETVVTVIDSHRPYNLSNIKAENDRVQIFDRELEVPTEPTEQEHFYKATFPDDDISSDDDDELDSDSDEEDEAEEDERYRARKRARLDMTEEQREAFMARKDKAKQLQDYYRASYFGPSSAVLLYDLAQQLNRDSNDLLWYSIIGLTEQYINEKVSAVTYTALVSEAQEEVEKYNPVEDLEEKASQMSGSSSSADTHLREEHKNGHIAFNMEYRFMLLRHWDLWNAMYHSRYVATRLGIWKEQGKQKLKNFLAKVGLPLEHCKQKFAFMHSEYKQTLQDKIQNYAARFNLSEICYGSFTRHSNTISINAADMVFAVTALLEEVNTGAGSNKENQHDDDDNSWVANFWAAYDCSGSNDPTLLKRGLEFSKVLQQAIVRQSVAMIKKKTIVMSGPFRYTKIEDSPDLAIFGQPLALSKLALFLSDTQVVNTNKQPKPYVVCSWKPQTLTYLLVGVTASTQKKKNSFGVAFREAADKCSARIKHDGFETSVMEVQKDDLNKFLEVLHSGLVKID